MTSTTAQATAQATLRPVAYGLGLATLAYAGPIPHAYGPGPWPMLRPKGLAWLGLRPHYGTSYGPMGLY